MNKEKVLNKLEEITKAFSFLSVDEDVADAIDTAMDIINESIQKDFIKEEREENLLKLLAEELKMRIGTNIYWSCKGWSIEKHTISKIKCDVYHGEFFKEYDGMKVVLIYTDNDTGYYIADELGKTLFFSREEAEKNLLTEKVGS